MPARGRDKQTPCCHDDSPECRQAGPASGPSPVRARLRARSPDFAATCDDSNTLPLLTTFQTIGDVVPAITVRNPKKSAEIEPGSSHSDTRRRESNGVGHCAYIRFRELGIKRGPWSRGAFRSPPVHTPPDQHDGM